jgi:hypothetical protein
MSELLTTPFRVTKEHIISLGNSDAADEQRRQQESLRRLKSEITLEYHVQLAALEEGMELMRENGGPTPEQAEDMRQQQEKIELDYQVWRAEFSAFVAAKGKIAMPTLAARGQDCLPRG